MSGCGDCSSCNCSQPESLTGGFSSGQGFALFMQEIGGLELGSEDDFFWTLALAQTPVDPFEEISVWEKRVAERFQYLKNAAADIDEG